MEDRRTIYEEKDCSNELIKLFVLQGGIIMSHGGRQELQKSLNMKDVLALAFGTMIGWGWIMLAGSWVASGGVIGAVIALLDRQICT